MARKGFVVVDFPPWAVTLMLPYLVYPESR